ncbi:MAG: hypothetical protein ACLGQH_01175, partial [Acidobacteriota bacterium]
SREIKEAVRNGVKIICAAVPYHSDDVLRSNPDLRGRIVGIDFNYWTPDALEKIAEKGFKELNIVYDEDFMLAVAKEAAGSPQLMQALCLNICFEIDVYAKGTMKIVPNDKEFLEKVCIRTSLMTDYSSIVEKLKEGPKTRGTERNRHTLKDGASYDVYPIVLRALAADPPELTFRYQNLQERINSLCMGTIPSGSSITGACNHIYEIGNSVSGSVIIEWDGENDVLDIRDPYLLFYLRWAAFSK